LASGSRQPASKAIGWVNWSGLATFVAQLGATFFASLERLAPVGAGPARTGQENNLGFSAEFLGALSPS